MTNQDSREVSRGEILQALSAIFIYSNNICNSLGGFEKQRVTFSLNYIILTLVWRMSWRMSRYLQVHYHTTNPSVPDMY